MTYDEFIEYQREYLLFKGYATYVRLIQNGVTPEDIGVKVNAGIILNQ